MDFGNLSICRQEIFIFEINLGKERYSNFGLIKFWTKLNGSLQAHGFIEESGYFPVDLQVSGRAQGARYVNFEPGFPSKNCAEILLFCWMSPDHSHRFIWIPNSERSSHRQEFKEFFGESENNKKFVARIQRRFQSQLIPSVMRQQRKDSDGGKDNKRFGIWRVYWH